MRTARTIGAVAGLAVAVAAAIASAEDAAPAATVTVVATGFRSADGQVLATLFASADGWPAKTEKAFRLARATVVDGTARLVFEKVPPGGYAAAVIHDENGSGTLDKNWLGIPKEGYAFSNDAIGSFGPPKFAAARFEVAAPATTVSVKMRY